MDADESGTKCELADKNPHAIMNTKTNSSRKMKAKLHANTFRKQSGMHCPKDKKVELTVEPYSDCEILWRENGTYVVNPKAPPVEQLLGHKMSSF